MVKGKFWVTHPQRLFNILRKSLPKYELEAEGKHKE